MVLRRSVCSGGKGMGLLLTGLLSLFLFPMAFAQEIQWIRQFGTEEEDVAYGVSVDMAGNVYVVGETGGTLPGQKKAGGHDAFVRKYDGNGNEIWTRQFGTENWDSAEGVSVDMAGNVYVVGYAGGTLPGQKEAGGAFVRKYDSNGNEIWTRQFGTEWGDSAYGVSVDMAGNVYVVGYTERTLPGQKEAGWCDAFVVKFGPGPKQEYVGKIVLATPLQILPVKDRYEVGDLIEAKFTIKNVGGGPITLSLLVGGRFNEGELPGGGYPDFPSVTVTLEPGLSYTYDQLMVLPDAAGYYHFFCAYRTKENEWNTGIELASGLTDKDRTKDIIVLPQGVSEPYILRIIPNSGVAGDTVTLRGVGFNKILSKVRNVVFRDPNNHYNTGSAEILSASDTEVVCRVPVLGLGPLKKGNSAEVALAWFYDKPVSNCVEFIYEKPVVESINPSFGDAGTEITIFGKNFGHERLGYVPPGSLVPPFHSYVTIGLTRIGEYGTEGIVSWQNDKITVKAPEDYGMGLSEVKQLFAILMFAVKVSESLIKWTAKPLFKWAASRLIKKATEKFQKKIVWEYDENSSLLVNYGKLFIAIGMEAIPGLSWFIDVDLCPTFELLVTVTTTAGESNAGLFKFHVAPRQVDIEDSLIAHLCSPGELRVYDSEGRVTGLVHGEVREEIPNSLYSDGLVAILSPSSDLYTYEVAGTGSGSYDLEIARSHEGDVKLLAVANVPISSGAIHQYSVDWDTLSQGKGGVTVQKDADGDGKFEETVTASPPTSPSNPVPMPGETEVPIDTVLRWSGGSPDPSAKSVSYRVYIGAEQDPPLKAEVGPYDAALSSIIWSPGRLEPRTTYYWRVIAVDNRGFASEGPLWSFTTRAAPLAIITKEVKNGVQGASYSQDLSATGGVPPYTWSIVGGDLPPGLVLDPEKGIISGVPKDSGLFSFTVQVQDNGTPQQKERRDISITINPKLRVITERVKNGVQGASYSQDLSAEGGIPPYTWSIAGGDLPPGLVLDPEKGIISGVPKDSGLFSFTVQVQDKGTPQQKERRDISITINPQLRVITEKIENGVQGASYSQDLSAEGGIPPYTWSIVGGDLPPGLVLDPGKGIISGVPKDSGLFSFTVEVRDSYMPQQIDKREFLIVVGFLAKHDERTMVKSKDGRVEVEIPPLCLPKDGWIVINPNPGIVEIPQYPKGWYGIRSSMVEIKAYDSDGNRILELNGPATLTIHYPDNDQDGSVDGTSPALSETSLRINTIEDGLWKEVPGSNVDPSGNAVSAQISHLSIYILIGKPTVAQRLENVLVYPNPFNPWKGQVVYFGHPTDPRKKLTDRATIRIYNVAGQLIMRIEEPDGDGVADGVAIWDGKDKNGNMVGSGVYIYCITNPYGERYMGRLAIMGGRLTK